MENFAIMRHAVEEDGGLHPKSVGVLRRVARDLAGVLRNGLTVRIFHSPVLRAELTAKEFAQALGMAGVNAMVVGPLPWLDYDEYRVTDENIAEAMHDDAFTVFITHEPIMKGYLRSNWVDPYIATNCSVWSPAFIIRGH